MNPQDENQQTPTPESSDNVHQGFQQPSLRPQVQPVRESTIAPAPLSPAVTTPAAPVQTQSSAGIIILQWLTYAFWGWTVLALSFLTTSIIANLIDDADTGWFTAYGIAAVLVLLPISFAVDRSYSKKEPRKKIGSEVLVMVVHAVLFALLAIGSLIVAVVALVTTFTSSNDSKGAEITLLSALIITAFYGLTFLRTLNPNFVSWIQKSFKFIMLVTVGVIAILGIAGPVAKERSTRDDRLIVSSIGSIERSISNYADANDRLPDNLEALNLSGDEQTLVERNLVTYKPEGPDTTTFNQDNNFTGSRISVLKPVQKYQLCVTYTKESNDYSSYQTYRGSASTDDYETYLSVYDHPAGNVCYKIKTSDY